MAEFFNGQFPIFTSLPLNQLLRVLGKIFSARYGKTCPDEEISMYILSQAELDPAMNVEPFYIPSPRSHPIRLWISHGGPPATKMSRRNTRHTFRV